MEIEQATAVKIYPTKVWIESDAMGARHVMMQHEGCDEFAYATFHYDYRYTSNGGTWRAANELATALGAKDPVEFKHRPLPPFPTKDEMREQIKALQELLQEDGA